MAGGKETPRQKMIGMMYLVLTALLALQVSNAVLEKFIFINGTLEELANENDAKNMEFIATIQAEVEKNKRPEHVKVLQKAEELRTMTTKLSEDMEALKDRMIQITGGYKDGFEGNKAKIVGAKDYEKVGNLMLKEQTGKDFEKQLDDYVAHLNKLVEEEGLDEYGVKNFPQLTKNGDEIEAFKDDPEQNVKDFLTITFGQTPTAAGMASVSQLEAEALEYEKNVLTAMAAKVGAAIVNFDVIVPMVKPEANRVPIGSNYVADLFVVASSSALNPKMEVNGQGLKVEVNEKGLKMGKINLRAGSPGTHKFETTVTMNDSTFRETYEYEVFTPTLQFASANLNALYPNCANALEVRCPDLGENYNPSFSATNAKTQKGGKLGLVKVIPTSRRVVDLSVSSGGVFIGKQRFAVKDIPAPSIQVLDRTNQRADTKESISAAAASVLTIKVEAEKNFALEAPEDKNYFVQEGAVFLPGAAPKRFRGARINVGNVRPGTITVQVDKIVRRRYDGSSEPVTIDNKYISVRVK